MKHLKLLILGVFLSFGNFLSAQENTTVTQTNVDSKADSVVVVKEIINPQEMSATELADLDIKTFLDLSEEQKEQFAEAEQQYITLRSQLASKGEERSKIEAKLDELEKRQMSNILDDWQLEKFKATWDLKKKAQEEINQQQTEQEINQQEIEKIFEPTID